LLGRRDDDLGEGRHRHVTIGRLEHASRHRQDEDERGDIDPCASRRALHGPPRCARRKAVRSRRWVGLVALGCGVAGGCGGQAGNVSSGNDAGGPPSSGGSSSSGGSTGGGSSNGGSSSGLGSSSGGSSSGVGSSNGGSSSSGGPEGGMTALEGGASSGNDATTQTYSVPVTVTVTFASDDTWPWYDGNLEGPSGPSQGAAADVCVNVNVPANCPAGAVIYPSNPNQSPTGWVANLSSIPTARWIWRGDVTPTADADLVFAVFQATFELGSSPTGTIHVACDDYAEVMVNGSVVGSTGSVTSESVAATAQQGLATFSLTPYLVEGTNTLTSVGQNGPNTYVGGGSTCSPCTYVDNTAGVVFGGSFTSVTGGSTSTIADMPQ
jgi:hypothetical protein